MPETQYRGLLTETEREILTGEKDVEDSYRYRVVSRVRDKIVALEEDIELLRTDRPDLYDELLEGIGEAARVGAYEDLPICEYCGTPIELNGRQCMARDDGIACDPNPTE